MPKTPHLPFYPFPPTAAASKLCCKGEEGQKRGGREITAAAASSCPHPLPLCSVPNCAHREQQLMLDPSTSPTPAAPCAAAHAALDLCSAACRAVPMGKHRSKHPPTDMWNYSEWRQHVHARSSNYLALHRNIASLTKSLYSIQNIRYTSVFSDHFTAVQHPPQSDQVAAAGLHRSTQREASDKTAVTCLCQTMAWPATTPHGELEEN